MKLAIVGYGKMGRLIEQLAPGAFGRLVDVGTGAGFPGLPIKLALPDLSVTLIEATGKKIAFVQHAIDALHLVGAEWVRERAEVVAHEPGFRENFDIAIARAVGNVATLAELLLPLTRVGGHASNKTYDGIRSCSRREASRAACSSGDSPV